MDTVSYRIGVSEDALEDAIAQCQAIVAAREQDPARLAEAYRNSRQWAERLGKRVRSGRTVAPPGLRMAEALQSVRQSLERNLRAKNF